MSSDHQGTTIVGAGLAGLLAAAIMRDRVFKVIESQPKLPNNHTAVMRFRSRAVADATNIPFRRVPVAWAVQHKQGYNDLAKAMMYSWNCTRTYDPTRSIARFLPGLFLDHRYVSPLNLPSLLANKVMAPIDYGMIFGDFSPGDRPIISTMPMPVLGKKLGYKFQSRFISRSGTNYVTTIRHKDDSRGEIDCYATLYNPFGEISRLTITGNKLIAESYSDSIAEDYWVSGFMSRCFGLDMNEGVDFGDMKVHRQRYAKIVPIEEEERRHFIRWATREHNVYSLGRYATWRPGLLLDDLVQDVRLITEMIWGGRDGENLIHQFRTKGNER